MRLPKLKSPKQVISIDEWDRVESESEAAKLLLEDPKFAFIREYLTNAQNSIVEKFARQSINDATIEDYSYQGNVVERVKKLFVPAKKEYSHLAGEYKFIERFLGDLKTFSTMIDEARAQREAGLLEIKEQ